MNPGPAPRPPTDRPRPEPLPSRSFSGSMSQLSLNASSYRSVSTYPAVGPYSPVLSRTTTPENGSGGFAIIKEGYVKCKEDKFGGFLWKTKYLILRTTQLDFQKSYDGKISLSIQLKDVSGVSRYDDIPLCIEITRVANPNYPPGQSIRDMPQKTIFLQFKTDEELYDWQDSIYTRCPTISGVSNPTNFSHRVHVGFDPTNGHFVGLPPEWEKLLTASAITKEDYQKNPQAVIEVLEFYDGINKRNQNPAEFPSLMPTPPAYTNQNMQLGHGGGGTAIAPPRPAPPISMDRKPSYQYPPQHQQGRYIQDVPSRSQSGTPVQNQRKVSGPEKRSEQSQSDMRQQSDSSHPKLSMAADVRRVMEEEARRVKEVQEKERVQRERERARDEEQARKESEAYNATVPKTRVPIAKQELGGYGVGSETSERYQPTRTAPTVPGVERVRQQPQGSLRQVQAQRQAPAAPNGQNASTTPAPRAPFGQQTSSSREQSPHHRQGSLDSPARPEQRQRQPSPSQRQPANGVPTNGIAQTQLPSRLPAPLAPTKPLNTPNKQQNGTPVSQKEDVPDAVKQAELALTKKTPAETRQKEVRMSSMSESEVMEKLKQIVTKQNPADSYQKQKKIGQGASGSVYVAKILPNAASPIARQAYREHGPKGQVAIKTMDLRNQPRKELIVNEIIVMKESMHPNIVNYLDAFLLGDLNELWVVMEFMEGGALTDIIDSNPHITEEQIAAICREVSKKRSLTSGRTNFS